ncbi:hypothetical protein FORC36_5218 (plasmid) [Vibrio vulnificus]|uniref:hypothetical protein n=1 Tax=Vibrio vulnificus TaxID=672 RepID=UPI0006572E6C|nr:hypothetical protein [Vibrio vulnificus]AKO77462.1 hypothetical protein EN12_20025 [Vibrio cholerae]ARN69735.1 hypothetical protein FORC36_5218 [Vibrio vulnificus]
MFSNKINHTIGQGQVITSQNIFDLEMLLLDSDGMLNVVSEKDLSQFTRKQFQFFCIKHGFYSIPTLELIEFIRGKILNIEKAIEIGSGNGVYGRSLGIIATDNFMQDPRKASKFSGVISEYSKLGQEVVPYGDNVIELDGREAVRKYKAETVVCSWVTHKYNPIKMHLGGNKFGVDFKWILDRNHTKRLILVGNKNTHKNNPIMELPHQEFDLDGQIYSRSAMPELDRVFIWDC